MTVPEAAVDENDFPFFSENQIGLAGQVRAVESVAVPETGNQFSNDPFRARVLTANEGHSF